MTERDNSSYTAFHILCARFFSGKAPDTQSFAEKYHLDEHEVRAVFNGQVIMTNAMATALAQESGTTAKFVWDLCEDEMRRERL